MRVNWKAAAAAFVMTFVATFTAINILPSYFSTNAAYQLNQIRSVQGEAPVSSSSIDAALFVVLAIPSTIVALVAGIRAGRNEG